METNNIFDGAYSRIIEDEAWQRVSGEIGAIQGQI